MTSLDFDHVKAVCAIGQGEKTCRYLMFGAKGWECAKEIGGGLPELLNQRVADGQMGAQGDNCAGPPTFDRRLRVL